LGAGFIFDDRSRTGGDPATISKGAAARRGFNRRARGQGFVRRVAGPVRHQSSGAWGDAADDGRAAGLARGC
jgi:hypothetical protein